MKPKIYILTLILAVFSGSFAFSQLNYSIVDDFNRSNSTVLGTTSSSYNTWSEHEEAGNDDQLQIVNNVLSLSTSGVSGIEPTNASIDFSNEGDSTDLGVDALGWAFHMDLKLDGLLMKNSLGWVLAANESDFSSATVDGYAVIWTATNQELVLIKFQDGLSGADPGTQIINTGLFYGAADTAGVNVRVETDALGNWSIWWETGSSISDATAIDLNTASSAELHNDFFDEANLVFTGPVWAHSSSALPPGIIDNFSMGGNKADLNITNVSLNTNPVLSGTSTGLLFDLNNSGTLAASQSTVKFYLSSDLNLDQNDILLDTLAVSNILAGNTESLDMGLIIPENTDAGTYYILSDADANDNLIESNEANNEGSISFTVNLYGTDLSYATLVMDDTLQNNSLNFSYDITNYGSSTAGKHVVKYYLSNNSDLIKDGTLISWETIDSVQFNSALSKVKQIGIPKCTESGYHYLKIVLDSDINVNEVNEANNIVVDSFIVTSSLPNLYFYPEFILSTNKTTVGLMDTVQVQTNIWNGSNAPVANSTIKYYLSVDQVFDGADIELKSVSVPSLAACDYTFILENLTIPGTLSYGDYYIIAQLDPDGLIAESDENDNQSVSQKIVVSNNPDIIIKAFSTQSVSAELGGSLPIDIIVENLSVTGDAGGSSVGYYLSADSVWDATDTLIGRTSISELGISSDTGIIDELIGMNVCAPLGAYYIIAKADYEDEVNEADETNNSTLSFSINLVVGKPSFIDQPWIDNITGNTADFSINIFCNGGATISEKGLYYSLTPNPESETKLVSTEPGSTINLSMNGLLPGTRYYAQAFATNSEGTVNSLVAEFETENITVTNITSSTAQVNWGHLGINSSNYIVRFYEQYSTDYNYKSVSNGASNTTILIFPNKTYLVELKFLRNGIWTKYTLPVEFSSSGEQKLADKIEISNIEANSASVNWKGKNADNYLIRYFKENTTDYKYTTSLSSPVTISIIPSTSYIVQIRSLLNGQWSNYDGDKEFKSADGLQKVASNLSYQNLSPNETSIMWDGENADNYLIRYFEENTTDYKYTTSLSSPVTIPVKPSTTYNVQIRTQVNGLWNKYGEVVVFTTQDGVNAIASNLRTSNISPNEESIIWDGQNADEYLIRYYVKGTTDYMHTTSLNSPKTILILPSTTYQVQIRTNVNGVWNDYSNAVEFTSSGGAQLIATNLNTTNISPNEESLSWDGANADRYLIRYYEKGTTNYQFKISSSSPTIISVLPATTYNVEIRTQINGNWTKYGSLVEFTSQSEAAPLSAENTVILKSLSNTAETDTPSIDTPESGNTSFHMFKQDKIGHIYPNPAKDVINLKIVSYDYNEAHVSIINAHGRVVESFERVLDFNNYQSYNIENLEKGIYFIRITTNGYSEVHQFIKM